MKELGEQCAALQPSLTPLLSDAANLTDYAVVFRYLESTILEVSQKREASRLKGDCGQD